MDPAELIADIEKLESDWDLAMVEMATPTG